MKMGTGLSEFADRFPDRFFDVGIAEEHAVTFAAALSMRGLKPVVAIYSTFLQRAYDQIIHDCALQKLDVIFAIDRSGLVGEDGPTHHGVFDISYLRIIPNVIIMSPRNETELRNMLYTATVNRGIYTIRYPRGSAPCGSDDKGFKQIGIGKAEKLLDGTDAAVLCVGNITNSALIAAEILIKQNCSVAVYDMKFIKPLDKPVLDEISVKYKKVITVEENSLQGGFGSAVLEYYNSSASAAPEVKRLGLPDEFIEHGNTDLLLKILKLDPEGLAESIIKFCK